MAAPSPVPRITTKMVALAWQLDHDPSDLEAGQVLAKLVLEAAEEPVLRGR
jgi:hypothetical protein